MLVPAQSMRRCPYVCLCEKPVQVSVMASNHVVAHAHGKRAPQPLHIFQIWCLARKVVDQTPRNIEKATYLKAQFSSPAPWPQLIISEPSKHWQTHAAGLASSLVVALPCHNGRNEARTSRAALPISKCPYGKVCKSQPCILLLCSNQMRLRRAEGQELTWEQEQSKCKAGQEGLPAGIPRICTVPCKTLFEECVLR